MVTRYSQPTTVGARRFSLSAALVAACCTVAVLPATASAQIILGKGAGNVKLGDSGNRVKAVLGAPKRSQAYAGGQSRFYNGYWLTLDSKPSLIGVEVTAPSQKTDKHIGPGSSLAAFSKAYPGAKCHSDANLNRFYRLCTLMTKGKRKGKGISNRFVFSSDKSLELVDIGKVGNFV